MNKEAYQLGVLRVLRNAGFQEKTAGMLASTLLHPATIFGGLGGLGLGVAAYKKDRPVLPNALRGAIAGAVLGAGMKHLPALIRRAKWMKPLHPYANDLGWVAPSLVAAPAILA